jgi:hypothetical protein
MAPLLKVEGLDAPFGGVAALRVARFAPEAGTVPARCALAGTRSDVYRRFRGEAPAQRPRDRARRLLRCGGVPGG